MMMMKHRPTCLVPMVTCRSLPVPNLRLSAVNSKLQHFLCRCIPRQRSWRAASTIKWIQGLGDQSFAPLMVTVGDLTKKHVSAILSDILPLGNNTIENWQFCSTLEPKATLSVLRRHPAQNRDMFVSLVRQVKCQGLVVNIDDLQQLFFSPRGGPGLQR